MAQLIKDGGYATYSTYVSHLCSLIEKWNLPQYDTEVKEETKTVWYRVRKTWADSKSQKGAYKILNNAKTCADENPGYSVFDENGKDLYIGKDSFKPYLVRVTIGDLNIRTGSGTDYARTGNLPGISCRCA